MLVTLAERERLTSLAYAGGWIALILAVAACLWIASDLFWQIMPGKDPDKLPTSGQAHSPAVPAVDTTRLEDLHLFGQAGSVTAPAIIDAPETTLDLILVGTLAGEDPSSGLAIIADGEGRESYYGVNDDLPGSARLHEIHSDRVLLVRQGQYETLSLRDNDDGKLNRPRRGVSGNRAVAGPSARSTTPGIRGGASWQALQQQSRIDPQKLAQNVSVLPYIENGVPVGVRLQAGRDAALTRLMAQAGLRNTDIITSVNGIPLNDPARSMEAISQLQNQTRFSVVVRRGGREQTLTIDLNQ